MPALLTVAFPELSSEDLSLLQRFRASNSPAVRVQVDPHFTLVFATEQLLLAEYTAHVQAVASEIRPISFTCKYAMLGADDEDDRAYVFLVPDDGFASISLLHDRLYSGSLATSLRLDIPYVPHITVGVLRDRAHAKTLCDQLNRAGVSITGGIRTLTVGTVVEGTFTRLSEHKLDA